jgi:hypothetical protein
LVIPEKVSTRVLPPDLVIPNLTLVFLISRNFSSDFSYLILSEIDETSQKCLADSHPLRMIASGSTTKEHFRLMAKSYKNNNRKILEKKIGF